MRKKLTEFKDEVIDNFDMFAAMPPQLNINKRTSVGTMIGLFASMSIYVVMILFAYTKIL
jgi:hypothetical protein